jgi:Glycosyltransferase 61
MSNTSSPVLYVFTRHAQMRNSAAADILNSLFPGGIRHFDDLAAGTRTCFRRLRWGRGPPFHYFAKTFPFPLPPSHPLYSSPLLHQSNSTFAPADAWHLSNTDLPLYTDIELGKWAGIMIDFHNWMLHQHGLERRIRVSRHRHTHAPLPGTLPVPSATPNVILLTRKGADRGRYIANPECLRDAFAALDPPVTLTYYASYTASMADQLAHFRDADIFIGLHGAAFTNLLYLAPGGLLLELETTYNYVNNFFAPLANQLDHTHIKMDARAYLSDFSKGHKLEAEFCTNVTSVTMEWWRKMHQDKEWRFRNVYT